MAIIPDLRINPYVTPYTPGPSQEFAEAIDRRIQAFDQNAEFSDVLGMQNDTLMSQIAPFEGDRMYANQIMNNTRKQIDEWAASGDYENMTRQIRNGARRFAADSAPLFENQKRYASYLTEMEAKYKEGKIGIDTLNKAKSASLSNYQGYDPNNPKTSLFSGFVPSDDLKVTEKVDKFLQGWKENGGTKFLMNPDGSYREINWESANENEIAKAAEEALMGDSDFINYAQTQGTIGNTDRINSEVNQAILAGVKKYGFYKEKGNLGWMPEYAFNNKAVLDFARNPTMAPSPATINPIKDVLEGTDEDAITGKRVLSNMIGRENGKYYKYTDQNGNIISKDQFKTGEASNIASTAKTGINAGPNYKKIEIPESEATFYTQGANQFIQDLAATSYLQEALSKGHISRESIEDPTRRAEFLRKNSAKFTGPEALKKAAKDYKEAVKNSSVIYDNERFDISAIPGAVTPETTAIKDEDIFANTNGQSIAILSEDKDLGGFRKGQKADLNSLLDKLQEDGFSVVGTRRLGPLKYNPYDSSPAMEMSIILEDGEKKKKVINVAANINDQELQPLQDVGRLAYNGASGDVDFSIPVPGGYNQGKFRVINAIGTKDGKKTFAPMVEIINGQGQKLATIPYNQFPRVYQENFAPNVITKYIDPKFRSRSVNPMSGQVQEFFGERVKANNK